MHTQAGVLVGVCEIDGEVFGVTLQSLVMQTTDLSIAISTSSRNELLHDNTGFDLVLAEHKADARLLCGGIHVRFGFETLVGEEC